ncbi:MAG: hypothetical protein BMS9Abin01_1617 [Gammaproteobacteria bacterium]|nr:MAG: hypothetical protein BMS9Abin01_1617 [Gammaproteobacteria bacterium]
MIEPQGAPRTPRFGGILPAISRTRFAVPTHRGTRIPKVAGRFCRSAVHGFQQIHPQGCRQHQPPRARQAGAQQTPASPPAADRQDPGGSGAGCGARPPRRDGATRQSLSGEGGGGARPWSPTAGTGFRRAEASDSPQIAGNTWTPTIWATAAILWVSTSCDPGRLREVARRRGVVPAVAEKGG